MSEHLCYGCMNTTENDICGKCGWSRDNDNETHQLRVGTRLRDQYIVGRALGQGGFGITYMGWDDSLDMPVAIKEFYPNVMVTRDSSVSCTVRCATENVRSAYDMNKERFLREAKALAKLRDIPEVVGVYSFFQENDTAYIIMEYVKGTDLATYIGRRGGRLGVDETFRILRPVMEALDKVHQAGLIHRDISPDNIILHPTGGAKLLDFGAVRSLEGEKNKSTEAILKHGFAPIEQYQAKGDLGPWSDEYALCATVFYCLTGRIPEEATVRTVEEVEIDFDIPGLTSAQQVALKKGMSVRAKDRYPSVGALVQALFEENEGPTEAMDAEKKSVLVADIEEKRPYRSMRRPNKKMRWLIAFVAVMAMGLILYLMMPRGWIETPKGRAYYTNGKRAVETWLYLEDGYYYVGSNGVALVGMQVIGDEKYYFDNEGKMSTGWVIVNQNKYYFDVDGKMLMGWYTIQGETYFFDEDGAASIGWTEIDSYNYYFLQEGEMARGWHEIDGKTYYFLENGTRITNQKKEIEGNIYYFGEDGSIMTGWQTVAGTGMCYFGRDGVMSVGWETIDGKRYFFRSSGKRVTGLQSIDGRKYYFDDDGIMLTGWQINCGDSYEELRERNKRKYGNDFEPIYTYYFMYDGQMKTGWLNKYGDTYFFDEEGRMCTGSCLIEGKWYYFDSDGKLQ